MSGPHPDELRAEFNLRAENERLAAQVNALVEVIRGLVISTRPGTTTEERNLAWRRVRAIVEIEYARTNHDFMARLAALDSQRACGVGEE